MFLISVPATSQYLAHIVVGRGPKGSGLFLKPQDAHFLLLAPAGLFITLQKGYAWDMLRV